MPATARLKSSWDLLKQTYLEWSNDQASLLAAGVAYYTIFSLAPLTLITIAILGFIFGQKAAHGEIHGRLVQTVGEGPAGFVESMLKGAGHTGAGIWATVIGVLLLLYAATYIFSSLQQSLNLVWNVEPKPDRSWWATLRDRSMTFVLVLGVGILLLASMVASTVISTLANFMGGASPIVMQIVNILISLALFTGIFALVLKLLPDARVRWRDVLIGAAFTAVLFTLAKWILGFYLSRAATTSVYGAAGSLVIILIFVYYSTQIFFFGAEFTQVYARRDGSPIEPAANAQRRPPKRCQVDQHKQKKTDASVARAEELNTPSAIEAGRIDEEGYDPQHYNLPGLPVAGQRGPTAFLRRHKWALAGTSAAMAGAAGALWWRRKQASTQQPPPR